jgi:hypothetical protein
VEEEHVLHEDETADLRNGREEAIEDAGREERVECLSACAPGRRGRCDNEEVEDSGQAADVGGEEDD